QPTLPTVIRTPAPIFERFSRIARAQVRRARQAFDFAGHASLTRPGLAGAMADVNRGAGPARQSSPAVPVVGRTRDAGPHRAPVRPGISRKSMSRCLRQPARISQVRGSDTSFTIPPLWPPPAAAGDGAFGRCFQPSNHLQELA